MSSCTLTVEENLDMEALMQPASTIAPNKEKVFELFREGAPQTWPAPCPAASSRCWPWAVLGGNASHPLMLDRPLHGSVALLVQEIFDIIQNIRKEGMTIPCWSSGNARMALSVADRAYVLGTGRVVMDGTGALSC